MLIDGEVVPWPELLDILADMAVDLRRVRQHHRCPSCGGHGVTAAGAACVEDGVWTPAGLWARCPYGLMTSSWWRAAVQVDAMAMVSPLAGWPDVYSAGIADALAALRGARYRAEERAAKRAAGRS